MVKFRFKLAYTEKSSSYEIPDAWTVEYAFLIIRDELMSDLNLNDNAFHIVCVDNISHRYQGLLEEYYEVDHSDVLHKSISDVYGSLALNTFYVRPLEDRSDTMDDIVRLN